jgi:predicted dehydrogenase
MSEVVKVGIIGSGGRSGAHAKAYSEIEGIQVLAFCDIIRERAESRAKEFGAKEVYTDYKELIKNSAVDVISICSPNETHAEVAIEAANAGIHVLVEKPMAQSLRECDEMMAAAQKNGVKLACNFQSRFFPRSHWVKKLIETGKMGDVVIAKGYGWTIHVWDLVRWIMGEPTRIFAEWGREKMVYKDPLLATVRFACGHLGFMQASTHFHEPGLSGKQNCLSFVGNKLTASFGLWANELAFSSENEDYLKEMETEKMKVFSEQSLMAPSVPDILDFLNAIKDDREPTVSGSEGKKSVEFVTATYKAAFTEKPVSLPIEKSDEMYNSPGRIISA